MLIYALGFVQEASNPPKGGGHQLRASEPQRKPPSWLARCTILWPLKYFQLYNEAHLFTIIIYLCSFRRTKPMFCEAFHIPSVESGGFTPWRWIIYRPVVPEGSENIICMKSHRLPKKPWEEKVLEFSIFLCKERIILIDTAALEFTTRYDLLIDI